MIVLDVGNGFGAFDCGKLGWCEDVRCVGQDLAGIAIGSGHLAVGKAALPSEWIFLSLGQSGGRQNVVHPFPFSLTVALGGSCSSTWQGGRDKIA